MSLTNDNQFSVQAEGQADWDTGLNGNFGILERGYHTLARAGVAVNTRDVLWMTSGGFFVPFDAASLDIKPHALSYRAVASGEQALFLLAGIVRSHAFVPGRDYFVAPASPGFIASSYSAASRKIGHGLDGGGLYFNPRNDAVPEQFTRVETIIINPTSEHLFTFDLGKSGVVRDLLMKSNSADAVGLAFYSNSARDDLLFQTKSGGVTTVASFVDRAMWPYDNTDASTLSGLIYGRIWADTPALVSSQAVQVRVVVDRVK